MLKNVRFLLEPTADRVLLLVVSNNNAEAELPVPTAVTSRAKERKTA